MTGLVLGDAVWAGLAAALVVVLVVTTVLARRGTVPSVVDVLRWFLGCWTGRLSALALWAVAGWHLFCQRP